MAEILPDLAADSIRQIGRDRHAKWPAICYEHAHFVHEQGI
jgi:hypothetical protein